MTDESNQPDPNAIADTCPVCGYDTSTLSQCPECGLQRTDIFGWSFIRKVRLPSENQEQLLSSLVQIRFHLCWYLWLMPAVLVLSIFVGFFFDTAAWSILLLIIPLWAWFFIFRRLRMHFALRQLYHDSPCPKNDSCSLALFILLVSASAAIATAANISTLLMDHASLTLACWGVLVPVELMAMLSMPILIASDSQPQSEKLRAARVRVVRAVFAFFAVSYLALYDFHFKPEWFIPRPPPPRSGSHVEPFFLTRLGWLFVFISVMKHHFTVIRHNRKVLAQLASTPKDPKLESASIGTAAQPDQSI